MRDETAKSRVGPLTRQLDPYGPAKITENRARPRNRLDWTIFGSDVTMVSPDEILRQGQRLPTPNSPPEVIVVVVLRKESQIDQIYKKTRRQLPWRRSQRRWGGQEGVTVDHGGAVGPTALRESSGLD
ncbi:hypothetical protein CRG98_043577 [Punica granatum]|uniref:Uncharacterized protein n=1 Tax=Punica granatum TaxID=22663 RepID=A0A2I0HWD7_PUNGR|nr:hypothetical protein CRG98_043577 [Punica granatum]